MPPNGLYSFLLNYNNNTPGGDAGCVFLYVPWRAFQAVETASRAECRKNVRPLLHGRPKHGLKAGATGELLPLQFRPMSEAVLEVDPELLHDARKLKRGAVEELLELYYPAVHRLAHGLTGHSAAARRTLRFVLSRSMTVLPTWKQEGVPFRWFMHHTVLSARRESDRAPDPATDVLVTGATSPPPAYMAFVRAVRNLPVQQKEAFLLHHGERLDSRQMGIVMDCSREAAAHHLDAATQTLSAVSGEQYQAFLEKLAEAYLGLTPPRQVMVPDVRRQVRRALWPQRLRRAVGLLLLLGLLAVLAWVAWRMFLVGE
jgi:DNA-directed RNA polymerase specialized sigma24 family protein